MTPTQFDDYIEQARQQLEAEEPRQAALLLALAAQAEGLFGDDERLGVLFALVAELGRSADVRPLADAAERATTRHPDALYELGYQLVDVGLPRIAVPVLRRLDRDQPGDARVVQELCAAYEQSGQHAAARDLLLANPALLGTFWPRYLLCFHALSAGDLATARRAVVELTPQEPDQQVPADRIRAMLARADPVPDTCPLDDTDLRGWHWVMNGSVLLHLSPYGFDDGMHGRYAFLNDQPAEIHAQLQRLVSALRAADRVPSTVLACAEPGSWIVAQAVGRLLEVPVRDYEPDVPGLVAVYDLGALTPETLGRPGPDGLLFARAARWTQPPPLVPDFVGLLHQYLVAPWNQDGAPDRSDAAWVDEILATELPARDDPDLDPLSAVLALARQGGSPSDRWFDGPVVSGRFG